MVPLTLRTRLILFICLIVASLVGLALLVTRGYVERQVKSQLREELELSSAVLEELLFERARFRTQQLGVVADSPRFSATLDIPAGDFDSHARTVQPVADELQVMIDSDLFVATDRVGRVLAYIERGQAPTYGQDLRLVSPVANAVSGSDYTGLLAEAGRLYQIVGVPVFAQDVIVGALITGFLMDDNEAARLKQLMHGHVSFLHDNELMGSSWEKKDHAQLLRGFEEAQLTTGETFLVDVGEETFFSVTHVFDPSFPDRGSVAVASPDSASAPSAVGNISRTVYVIQLSLDEALEFVGILERALLGIGGAVLLVAIIISVIGSRRLTQPVEELQEGTQRLAAGDLEHRIPVKRRDEFGGLAQYFNDMAAALALSTQALETSERAYRDLFDNANDLVFTTDLNLVLTSANRAAQQFFGLDSRELVGTSLYALLAPEDTERLSVQEELAVPGDPRPSFEAAFIGRSGNTSTFEVVSRWLTEADDPVGIHAIARDVTDRRERELATVRFREQLHQAEKLRALGEMAGGVAHNFNNLLTVILMNAELLALREDVSTSVREEAERIVESARSCSAIVRRIQTFGRPTDPDRTDQVDLSKVVVEIIDMTIPKWKTEPERQGRSIHVETDLADIPPIETPGSAWQEILSNLIFNAVDAMPEGGTISVSTRYDSGQVQLTVSDTGIGMDEETRRRVFEPFFTTKGSGWD
jgi:PAS domain S-box-containing protein